MPNYIQASPVPTGGGFLVQVSPSEGATTCVLTRTLESSTPITTTIYSGDVFSEYLDMGSGQQMALANGNSYIYTYTDSGGSLSTTAQLPTVLISAVGANYTQDIMRILDTGINALNNYPNKPRVLHGLPVSGNKPKLPIITVNLDLIQMVDNFLGIATQSDSDVSRSSALFDNTYSLWVITSTIDEREFIRNVVIGILLSLAGPSSILEAMGQNVSISIQASQSQTGISDTFPGYYSKILMSLIGPLGIRITHDYGHIAAIDGVTGTATGTSIDFQVK